MEGKPQNFFNVPSLVACPQCGLALTQIRETSLSYFQGTNPICPNCKKEIDWWNAILSNVKANAFTFLTLSPVGAQQLVIPLTLLPNTIVTINFHEYGIPSDAKILDIIYSISGPPSEGGLFPLEFYGNRPPRHNILNTITLYPMPLPGVQQQKETSVQVVATWVPHNADDESWQNLVDAFEAYSQNRFNACIISSNVAVESKLARLLTRYLHSIASKENIEDFLENGATYSHQINVVLPLILKGKNIPLLPDKIRGLLNRLRGLRNTLAHEGKLDKDLTKDETAELIVASFFGFQYLTLINEKINTESAT
jgi:hypothetical protein